MQTSWTSEEVYTEVFQRIKYKLWFCFYLSKIKNANKASGMWDYLCSFEVAVGVHPFLWSNIFKTIKIKVMLLHFTWNIICAFSICKDFVLRSFAHFHGELNPFFVGIPFIWGNRGSWEWKRICTVQTYLPTPFISYFSLSNLLLKSAFQSLAQIMIFW